MSNLFARRAKGILARRNAKSVIIVTNKSKERCCSFSDGLSKTNE